MNSKEAFDFSSSKLQIDTNSLELRYYLLKLDSHSDNYNRNCSLYGIKVEKVLKNTIIETDTTGWISDNRQTVLDIINFLCRHSITPVALPYIVEDYISEISMIV